MEFYKKHLMIEEELAKHTKRVQNLEAYLDSINLHNLADRIEWKPTSKGGTMPMVIASKEAQVKSYAETAEKLTKLYTQLDELRNKYAEKEFIGRGKVRTENTAMDFLDSFTDI